MHHFNTEIEHLITKQMALTKNKQMTEEEYRFIASLLADKKFLVFGTGLDSTLWREANKDGLTIFLEDSTKWIDSKDKDVYQVKYTSKLTEADSLLEKYKNGNDHDLKIELPTIVKNTKWDIILLTLLQGTNLIFTEECKVYLLQNF